MEQLIIASQNEGKIKEFRTLFQSLNIEVLSLNDVFTSIPEVVEDGDTFEANARKKAETILELVHRPVIADDSGLVIDALEGRPGVYSARYAGEPSDDRRNYEKVLKEMEGIPQEKRGARFVAVLALARPNEKTEFFHGTCEGSIAFEAKGSHGFGYDPIFLPQGESRTMAELSEEEKHAISHRGMALRKLHQFLQG